MNCVGRSPNIYVECIWSLGWRAGSLGEEVANAILKPVKHLCPEKILGLNIDQIIGPGAFGLVHFSHGNFRHTVCLFLPIMQQKTSPITSTVLIIGKTDSQEAVLRESTLYSAYHHALQLLLLSIKMYNLYFEYQRRYKHFTANFKGLESSDPRIAMKYYLG